MSHRKGERTLHLGFGERRVWGRGFETEEGIGQAQQSASVQCNCRGQRACMSTSRTAFGVGPAAGSGVQEGSGVLVELGFGVEETAYKRCDTYHGLVVSSWSLVLGEVREAVLWPDMGEAGCRR